MGNLAEGAVAIWCMATVASGGLGWSAERIGEAYSACGMLALVFQLTCAPAILNRWGAHNILCWTRLINFPISVFLPMLGVIAPWLNNEFITFWIFVGFLFARNATNSVGSTGLAIITNKSVSSEVRCRLQGTITSVQS